MSRLTQPVGPADHVLGSADAPVTLLEYGDYECQHCARAYHVVIEVLHRFGDRMRYAYRHFPLTHVHPHALAAAEAAEAAAAQGRFWPMHGILFERQNALEDEDLISYAQALGLDVRRFIDDSPLGTTTTEGDRRLPLGRAQRRLRDADLLHQLRALRPRVGRRYAVHRTRRGCVEGARPEAPFSDSNWAEEKGFEPLDGCPSAVFKTAALNRSATPPKIVLSLATPPFVYRGWRQKRRYPSTADPARMHRLATAPR